MKRLLAIFALSCAFAQAQTVQPLLQPRQTFVDSAGSPCTGCKLYSYSAGTTSALATYTDSTGVTPNTNPIVLDTAGGANIWTGASSYKFVLKDALGNTFWTVDNVQGAFTDPTARTAAAAAQSTANAALPAFGMTSSQGSGTKVQHSTGTPTTGDFVKFVSGDTVDAALAVTAVPQSVATCGTTTTCANTAQTSPRIVWGTVALTSASPSTAVVTGMTAWTATTSFACTVTNRTTQANPVSVANTSTTSITITGPNTVTDTVAYICVGN